MKKKEKEKLRLPIYEFIKRCWDDQRGFRRQFLNGLLQGLKEQEERRKQVQENEDQSMPSKIDKKNVYKEKVEIHS